MVSLLLILSLVSFLIATFAAPIPRVNLTALGLAFLVASMLFPGAAVAIR
jgi:uncharacterized membrane protein